MQDSLTKCALMQTNANNRGRIGTSGNCSFVARRLVLTRSRDISVTGVVDRDSEGVCCGVVSDHEYWPRREVSPLSYAMQIHKRKAPLHRRAQTSIVSMVWVRSPIAVAQ